MTEQWLTYAQAGALLGMTAEAVRQRARRFGWRTQKGNDGRMRVWIPADKTGGRPRVRSAVQTLVQTPGQTGDVNALAAILRDELERERAAREAAQAAAISAIERAAQAEGEASALRDTLGHERQAREAAEAAKEAAEAARDAAQGEAAEWAAGNPFARAWRAFWRKGGR